jgi:syntaxin 5
MAVSSIQDRTNEFRSVLTQVQKRQATSKVGAQRQSLLTDSQKAAANGSATGDGKPRRSEFARRAAEIGRGISVTMGKLEKLAQRTALWREIWRYCMLTLHSGQEENALR